MYIGSHVTISKGYEKAAEITVETEGNIFQFFSRNPRGAASKELDLDDVEKMNKIMKDNNFGPILAHGPYILNLASHKGQTYGMGKAFLKEDYVKLDSIGVPYFNIHPGNHLGKGSEYGIERIADALNETIEGHEDCMILLETMSGRGTEVGYRFEELGEIISKVEHSHLVGVCLDTCHIYSAGYDIVNNLDGVLEEFDKHIGIDKLKAIHLNDSLVEFASKKDRHAKIGEGTIGLDAIKELINHSDLRDLPFYLETPNELEGYREEIRLLKSLRK